MAAERSLEDATETTTRARPWLLLSVTSLAVYMAFLDTSIVNVAFPSISRGFPGTSLQAMAWIVDIYTVFFAAALVPSGRLGDRFGRRRFFLLGLLVFTVASIACGSAPTAQLLIITRAVQACGAAMLMPNSLALLVAGFPAHRRTTALAFWGGAGAVATATGPPLGGFIVASLGWRPIFFINVPIGAALLALGRRCLVDWRNEQARMPDVIGTVFFAAATAAVVVGIAEFSSAGPGSRGTLGALVVFGIAMPAFCWRNQHHAAPVFNLDLFRAPGFTIVCIATFIASAGFYSLLLENVLFLSRVWRLSSLQVGLWVCPGAIAAFAAAGPAGRLADHVGERFVAVLGGLLFACGAAGYALLLTGEPNYWSAFLPATILIGVGVTPMFAALNSAGVAGIDPNSIATGAGLISCIRQIGASLGVAIMVTMVATAPAALSSYQHMWLIISVTGVSSAALAALLKREPRLVQVSRP